MDNMLWNDSSQFTIDNNDQDVDLVLYDLGLTNNVLVGTCIINDCDPCIKVAIGACVKLCKGGRIHVVIISLLI